MFDSVKLLKTGAGHSLGVEHGAVPAGCVQVVVIGAAGPLVASPRRESIAVSKTVEYIVPRMSAFG